MWPILLLACAPQADLRCTAELDSDVPTLLSISWAADGDSHVEFGVDEALGNRSPVSTGAEHRVPLYGMPADSTVYWRAVTEGVGECSGQTRTGSVPDETPSVTISIDTDGRSSARWIAGNLFRFIADEPRLAAFDRQTGQWVWAIVGNEGQISSDMQFAAGSNDVIFNQFDAAFAQDTGNLRRITLAGDTVWEWPTPLAHHMFAQLPDGKIAFQSLDVRPWTPPEGGEELQLIGDRVMELDPSDGATAEIFNAWDWLPVEENRHWEDLSLYPFGVDWTHGNALKYTAARDELLLSLGHADVLIEFGRQDGQAHQMYGLEGIPVAEGDLHFDYQHDPGWTQDGTLLMFSTDITTEASGAIEYELREGELHQVWAHDLPGGQERAIALGQAQRLDNGNTFITYGTAGVLREVDPQGQVVWEALADPGHAFAQVRLVEDWYAP